LGQELSQEQQQEILQKFFKSETDFDTVVKSFGLDGCEKHLCDTIKESLKENKQAWVGAADYMMPEVDVEIIRNDILDQCGDSLFDYYVDFSSDKQITQREKVFVGDKELDSHQLLGLLQNKTLTIKDVIIDGRRCTATLRLDKNNKIHLKKSKPLDDNRPSQKGGMKIESSPVGKPTMPVKKSATVKM
jgi:hypothetical protein